jgi:transposase
LGVDTHLDLHVAVALDQLGRRLGELTVPTTTRGYERLLRWVEGFGPVGYAGIEWTSSYGAGLARHLKAARISAVKARSQAANQLQALLVTAPEDLRHRLRELPTKELVASCARFRLGNDPDDVETATKFALRSVARRHEALSEEIIELDVQLDRLVAEVAPELISLPAIGTHHAATLLVVAGDNPQRLRNEAPFASLCGLSPIEASSGKVVRHRLNRGGNRDAYRALHMICVVRMGSDKRTREYVARRTAEGKSKWEIIRCLKRYIAREVYRVLVPSTTLPSPRMTGL